MSSIFLPDCIPTKYQEKAEEVRAYLVQIRGGAPFLSGADGQILIRWLEDEIPVPAILSAIDAVSERRRAKRVRTRLSLKVCTGNLRKILGKTAKKNIKSVGKNPICDLANQISQMKVPATLSNKKDSLVEKLLTIGDTQLRTEENISQVMHAGRAFHAEAWIQAEPEQEQLQIASEQELSALRAILPAIKWQEAVEEVMRDKVRMRYPLISAQKIWDAINQTDID